MLRNLSIINSVHITFRFGLYALVLVYYLHRWLTIIVSKLHLLMLIHDCWLTQSMRLPSLNIILVLNRGLQSRLGYGMAS